MKNMNSLAVQLNCLVCCCYYSWCNETTQQERPSTQVSLPH